MIYSLKRLCFVMLAVALFTTLITPLTYAQGGSAAVLTPADTAKLLPPSVFFHGQAASIQGRNSGGVHLSDGSYVLVTLVDASGYSTAIKQKYQAYLITETSIEVEGHSLPPGAYGCGFLPNNQFVVMDIGGHDLFTVSSKHDEAMHRPMPLKVAAGEKAGSYTIYAGRDGVTFTISGK